MVDLTEDGSELDSSRSEDLSGDDGYDGIISKALCESILKQMGDEQTYSGGEGCSSTPYNINLLIQKGMLALL